MSDTKEKKVDGVTNEEGTHTVKGKIDKDTKEIKANEPLEVKKVPKLKDLSDPKNLEPGHKLIMTSNFSYPLAVIYNAPNRLEFRQYLKAIAAPNKTVHDKYHWKQINRKTHKSRKIIGKRNEFHKYLTPNCPCPCGKKNPNNGKSMKWKKCHKKIIPVDMTMDEFSAYIATVDKAEKKAKEAKNGKDKYIDKGVDVNNTNVSINSSEKS